MACAFEFGPGEIKLTILEIISDGRCSQLQTGQVHENLPSVDFARQLIYWESSDVFQCLLWVMADYEVLYVIAQVNTTQAFTCPLLATVWADELSPVEAHPNPIA